MGRLFACVTFVALAAVGCKAAPLVTPAPSAARKKTPTPVPTQPSKTVPAGGTVAFGKAVRTRAGDTVTVYGWHRGANRAVAPGPGEVYESFDVGFCAGPQVEEAASDLNPLFSLLLRDGEGISPDSSYSGPGEFKTLGKISAGHCVRGPVVFQIPGGPTPRYFLFSSSATTKWTVY